MASKSKNGAPVKFNQEITIKITTIKKNLKGMIVLWQIGTHISFILCIKYMYRAASNTKHYFMQ